MCQRIPPAAELFGPAGGADLVDSQSIRRRYSTLSRRADAGWRDLVALRPSVNGELTRSVTRLMLSDERALGGAF
jgi:hypothetical protein